MRNLLLTSFIMLAFNLFAQNNNVDNTLERKGFIFGLGIGGGALNLNTNDTTELTFSTTLPNIKVGYMLNSRLAICALLPGAVYKYNETDRGFEAIMIAGQYWLKDQWWVLGAAGLTFDAPAFYTIKDPTQASFYTGFPSLSISMGYEIWHKGRFSLDLQYRLFYGKSKIGDNGQRTGVANMFIVGFNWY